MKRTRKAIALLLSVLLTLSVFSLVGYAEDGTENPGPFTVTFYNRSQNEAQAPQVIGDPQTVNKGEAAQNPAAGKSEAELKTMLVYPDYLEQSFDVWAFDGWSIDFSNVQKDLQVYPKFTTAPKMYHINYFNFDGSAAEGLNSEFCLFGGYPQESSHPSRMTDNTYFYDFECWSLKKNIDPTVNKDDEKYMLNWKDGLALPTDQMLGQVKGQAGYIDLYGTENDDYVELNVYAYYTRHTREYPLSLTVIDTYGQRVAGADVQLLGANGLLLDQTIAQEDEDGNYTGRYKPAAGKTDANGELLLRVPYQTEYTLQVSHGDYDGAKIQKIYAAQFANNRAVTVQLESPTQYNEGEKARCTCACHSFIGGIWVTCLNLMYTLFKVKYVCCYDMYATHGSKLAYGA